MMGESVNQKIDQGKLSNLKNMEKKREYDEETNRRYLRTQIKFLKMENTVSDIKNTLNRN